MRERRRSFSARRRDGGRVVAEDEVEATGLGPSRRPRDLLGLEEDQDLCCAICALLRWTSPYVIVPLSLPRRGRELGLGQRASGTVLVWCSEPTAEPRTPLHAVDAGDLRGRLVVR